MIVLGDKIRSHISELHKEQWFMSYIGQWNLIYVNDVLLFTSYLCPIFMFISVIKIHVLSFCPDLLSRCQLWSVATEVIKLSKHPAVSALNQQSTTIHTHCSTCTKPMSRSGWLCDCCQNYKIITCSIWWVCVKQWVNEMKINHCSFIPKTCSLNVSSVVQLAKT